MMPAITGRETNAKIDFSDCSSSTHSVIYIYCEDGLKTVPPMLLASFLHSDFGSLLHALQGFRV